MNLFTNTAIFLTKFANATCHVNSSGLAFTGILDASTFVTNDSVGRELRLLHTTLMVDTVVANQIVRGETLTVNDTQYTVTDTLLLDDGVFTTLLLERA